MTNAMNWRDLLKLAGMGVAVFVPNTTLSAAEMRRGETESFYFVQLSDTHWGFRGPNLNPDSPIFVLTHRPLFDLVLGLATLDGAAVIDTLMQHRNVTVLYGHISPEHHHMSGHIAHHAAKSTMRALPEPGSVRKKAQISWNPAEAYKGIGFRKAEVARATYKIEEFPAGRAQ